MGSFDNFGNRRPGPLGIRTPTPLAWVNPFIAQADVLCGTESTFGGGWCGFTSGLVPSNDGVIINDGVAVPMPEPMPAIEDKGFAEPQVQVIDGNGVERGVAPNDVVDPTQPFGPQRDTLWTKSVATWLVLSVIFVFLSVQAVSPTRRWHLRRPRRSPRSAA
jgi:hypothetical protein